MLDIIIPQYSENDNKIKPLLDSINNQINIDFNDINVTIVNDLSNVLLTDKFLKSYPNLKIKYLINDFNGGCGPARQKGVDNTSNPYIMYMDADDEFATNISLYILLNCIKDAEPDFIISNIVQDIFVDNKKSHKIRKGKDTFPWMHGKVFKREILDKNNVRFHDKLKYFEDSNYTICYMSCINENKMITLDFNCYWWKSNGDSTTRKKRKYGYVVEEFNNFFYSPIYAYDFLKNKKFNSTNNFMINAVCGLHQILNSNLFNYDELKEKREFFNNELIKFISNNKQIFKDLTFDKLQEMYDEEYKVLKARDHFEIINGIESLAKMLNIK